jgi:hypothetical protein
MTNKLCKLLEKNKIKVLETILPEYWEECDDSIILDNNLSIQVGDNYFCLCQDTNEGMKYLKEIELSCINNTAKVNDFINTIKQYLNDKQF